MPSEVAPKTEIIDPIITLCIPQSHVLRIQVVLHERMQALEYIALEIMQSKVALKLSKITKLSEDRELTRLNLMALTASVQQPLK